MTYIDEKGFVYCEADGKARRGNGRRCRKLRPHEKRRLEQGKTIRY